MIKSPVARCHATFKVEQVRGSAASPSSLDIGQRRERRLVCRQVRPPRQTSHAMSSAQLPISKERNRLLLALPHADYLALLPSLEAVVLARGALLFEARERIRHVYFPQRCVISLLTAVEAEPRVEVGLVGNEGMVGLTVFLGATTASTQAVLQVPDGAWRMEVAAFRRAAGTGTALHRVLQRYTQTVISQVTQCLACNQRHAVSPRCARWLLMAHDRVGADRFTLTQEFLGQMLGTRRPTVSRTARGLQSRGLIRYSRGTITVTDRVGLETAACGCYDVMERDYARAFA
jgi:CRP-like cAMP-binding protein